MRKITTTLTVVAIAIPIPCLASIGPWFEVQLGQPIDLGTVHVTGNVAWTQVGKLAVWAWGDENYIDVCTTDGKTTFSGPAHVVEGSQPALAPLTETEFLLAYVNTDGHVEAMIMNVDLAEVGKVVDLGEGSHPAATYVPGMGPAVACASGQFVYVYLMRFDAETASLTPEYRISIGPLTSEPVAVSLSCPGDVNRDGKLDLFVAFQLEDKVYVMAYWVSGNGPASEGGISVQGENPFLVSNVLLYDDRTESKALVLTPSGSTLRAWDAGVVGPGVNPRAALVDDLYLTIYLRGDALDCTVGIRFSSGSSSFYPYSTYTQVGCLVPATVRFYAVGSAGDTFEVFASSGSGALVFPVEISAVNPVESLRSQTSTLGPLILGALAFTAGIEAAVIGPDAYRTVPMLIVPPLPPSCRRGPRDEGRSS